MSAHPFDAAVALQPQADGTFLGHTSAAYANMVGPFGGVTAAQALNAVLQHSQRLGDPISLTVNFAAALDDGPFIVSVRPARTNRSTQHWVIEMQQNGETVLTGTAFFGLRRETWGADEHTMPDVPAAAEVPRATGPARVEWVKRYEMRFAEGAIPVEWSGTDQGVSRTRLWLRDDPPRLLDFASLTALSDVFFPRVWSRRPLLVPIGTVSMTVYYHADNALLQRTGSGHLLGQTQAQAFRNGYFDQTAQLWNQAGNLLVTTHQVVYYKE
ncbi:MAG: thioesterase family protein [Polaromonas sp.]|uniref:acyl-CoA thioesterase n=1 Tax=Polaromonas sp. TaxID=1869339 RepID=UPI00183B7848|nr:thioesterase family protein [Polaromonas sp.]MBA3593741.1 thioesterase family protein [Polaromonas sp.]